MWDHVGAGHDTAAPDHLDRTFVTIGRLGARNGDLFYHLHPQVLQRCDIIATAHAQAPTLYRRSGETAGD